MFRPRCARGPWFTDLRRIPPCEVWLKASALPSSVTRVGGLRYGRSVPQAGHVSGHSDQDGRLFRLLVGERLSRPVTVLWSCLTLLGKQTKGKTYLRAIPAAWAAATMGNPMTGFFERASQPRRLIVLDVMPKDGGAPSIFSFRSPAGRYGLTGHPARPAGRRVMTLICKGNPGVGGHSIWALFPRFAMRIFQTGFELPW